jgi:type III restriction enzyme
LHDLLDRSELHTLRDALTEPADKAAVEAYWEQERPIGSAAKRLDQYAKPLRIAQLTFRQGNLRSLFEPEELDTFSWDMDRCTPVISEAEFASDVLVGSAAIIDVEASPGGRGGGLVTKATGDVRLKQLELIGEGDDWSEIELTRWLDAELHRGDSFLGLPLSESQPWLHRVVDHLLRERKLSLPVVVRRRHLLSELLRTKVGDHGRAQTRRATAWLIESTPDAVETSDEFAFTLEEQNYTPSRLYEGGHQFSRHAFDLIGEMNSEEAECATLIDRHPNVARWVRNVQYETQGGFSLPKSPGRFYPDFIVELLSGVIVLVEYKMGKIAAHPDEQHKRAVGQLWEDRSHGRGRFAWVVDKDWHRLAANLAG